ncbi:MAG: group 1 truncated hemoglobin [Reichenbachiella sp.]|uniref:group I truncated hemoglobin n=1 Tax=Reichenbachiella sp. TaxID=2184521 RepID=UPI003264D633
MHNENARSLYERIGGAKSLDIAIDIFYRKVLADRALEQYFKGVDMQSLQSRHKAYLMEAFGGPVRTESQDLENLNSTEISKGIHNVHLDCMSGYLISTMENMGIGGREMAEVRRIVENTNIEFQSS